MKKQSLTLVVGLCLVFLAPPAAADIEVVPMSYDFVDVEVGTSSTTIITISNVPGNVMHPIVIYGIYLQSGSSPDFEITVNPDGGLVLQMGESADIEITFTPSAEGYVSAVLVIECNDPFHFHTTVALGGTGVTQEPPPAGQIAEILDFFDASVADGDLAGQGPGSSAENRLNALRNMLEAAGNLIEVGEIEMACEQLASALKKTDGLPNPPDFVTGDAASELAAMIVALRETLGC